MIKRPAQHFKQAHKHANYEDYRPLMILRPGQGASISVKMTVFISIFDLAPII